MWESRVLCEISKFLWEPLFGFHRNGISTAVFVVDDALRTRSKGGCYTLAGWPIVVSSASYAVVSEPASPPIESAADHGRRLGTKGPGARPRRDDFGIGAAGVGRERSVR